MRPPRHELDQEQAFLSGLAAVVGSYVRDLQACGLSRGEAVYLALAWQQHYLGVTSVATGAGAQEPGEADR